MDMSTARMGKNVYKLPSIHGNGEDFGIKPQFLRNPQAPKDRGLTNSPYLFDPSHLSESYLVKMVVSTRPPANAFVAAVRKIYNPLGFSRGYSFVLWFIFSGAFAGFILARLQYLDFSGIYCSPDPSSAEGAMPGECWYYVRVPRYKVGIILHLATILPAGLLACVQFTPFIRHKALILHRINGWLVVLLSFAGTAAAMMIARISFGGGLDAQMAAGALAIMFIGSLVMAVVNIKLLQIEEHRAWMLRAWFYVSCPVIPCLGCTNRLPCSVWRHHHSETHHDPGCDDHLHRWWLPCSDAVRQAGLYPGR